MKAQLTMIGAVLVLAACTPASHTAGPSAAPVLSPSPASSESPVPPSAVPVESPSPVPTGKCAYPPSSVPDRVMVRDVFHEGTNVTENCVDRRPEEPFFEYLPDPCGRDLGIRTSSIVARRAIEVIFDDDPSNGYPQASMYRHTVTVYNGADAASAYLSSVRAAVRECPTRTLKEDRTWKYAILSSTAQRLELSVRHLTEHPHESGSPPEAAFRVSVFRSGARVSVLSDIGWEGYPSTKLGEDALVKAAAEQLGRW